MLPMSSPDVNPGAVETQQMRVIAPAGASILPLSSCLIILQFTLVERAPATADIVHCGWTPNTRPGRLCRLPPWIDGRRVIDG